MVFSSAIFLYWFLPITFLIYFIIPNKKCRNIILTVASILFYAFGQLQYLPLLLFSVLCNYIFGILLSKQYTNILKRQNIIAFAVIVNIGILCVFKYTDFLIESLNTILHTHIPTTGIPLPIGISFFTFQGISYVIDVYRNRTEGTNSFLKVLLYISFFPQLIAGPIIKYHDISNEIDNRVCTLKNTAEGLRRFTIGLAKKLLLSNTVGLVTDSIFELNVVQIDMRLAWLGAVCYVFQIYFDFSGYSDMAIGLGRILGFKFAENFNYPYISTTITEFWRRWHISLSTFFRDYVYIPLGGNRKGNVYLNLLVVFLLTGLWHGASFNFIIWGVWHGFFIVLERFNKKHQVINIKCKGMFALKYIYTMLVVMVGWVFFRADTIEEAMYYIGRMFNLYPASQIGFTVMWYLDKYILVILSIAIIVSSGVLRKVKDYMRNRVKGGILLVGKSAVLGILLITSMIYVMTSTYNPFIYFKF